MSHKCVFATRATFECPSINTVMKLQTTAAESMATPRNTQNLLATHCGWASCASEISFHWVAATANSASILAGKSLIVNLREWSSRAMLIWQTLLVYNMLSNQMSLFLSGQDLQFFPQDNNMAKSCGCTAHGCCSGLLRISVLTAILSIQKMSFLVL